MSDKNEILTLDLAREALLRSGYLLERRVENMLNDHGYFVQSSPVYPDPHTGKHREYDLSAISFLGAGEHKFSAIWPLLLIECVNPPQPIVFFTKESSFKWHCEAKLSGVPVRISDDGGESWASLVDVLKMEDFHHYCSDRVATQYCSFQKKKQQKRSGEIEWMALHEERHFETIKKLCDVVNYHANDHFKNWVLPEKRDDEYINVQIYYPVIIVQGLLYDAQIKSDDLFLYETSHILFCQNTISGSGEESYLIDVISESYLPDFLQMLDAETKRIQYRAKRNKRKINSSIDLIVEEARNLDKDRDFRSVLEF